MNIHLQVIGIFFLQKETHLTKVDECILKLFKNIID